MSGPYFQKQSWPAFTYQGQSYDLTHLDEYAVEVNDSAGNTRRIAISFSDHCFTREPVAGDDPALAYPHSSRRVGHFCTERYQHSLNLAGHIAYAIQRRVWHVLDGSYAIVPVITQQGIKMLYGIVFSLDRVKGFPVELHMKVKTAHPRDERDIVTFGEIRFSHLVTLRMKGKHPLRITDQHRKRPKAT
jgi:hypothetical protein